MTLTDFRDGIYRASVQYLTRSELADVHLKQSSPAREVQEPGRIDRSALLRDEGLTVGRAAERVGYEAEAAFSRAFKRQFGVAPATYRQCDPRSADAPPSKRNGRADAAH